jgi:hypothetical protein
MYSYLYSIRIAINNSESRISEDLIGDKQTRRLNRGSSVGVMAVYGLEGLGSISAKDEWFFCIPELPNRLWSSPSLLSDGHPWNYSGRSVKIITHLPLLLR